jgi:hypothetical protein
MRLTLFFLIILFFSVFQKIESKEAVLLFSGVFGTKYKMERMKQYFIKEYNYDVYWINFLTPKSWDDCMMNLKKGISEINLEQYEKVHIFCHIFGGRILLEYFQSNKIEKLSSIVFDRGPVEEELAVAARNKSGDWALKITEGQSLVTFSYKDHFHIPANLQSVKIGIIIETKYIPLCYFYRNEIKKDNPSFNISKISEKYDDYFYIPLNHRQMYTKLNKIIPEVNRFFKYGHFSDNVMRDEKNFLEYF